MTRTKKTEALGVSKQEQIEQLKAQLAALTGESEEFAEIKQNEYVRVMSLFPGHLNLSTEEQGQGKVFRFADFGDVKRILYSDLTNILEVHSKFANSGYFIILDPRVIRNHGLDDAYAKILTKEKIDRIISGSTEAPELFKSSNTNQRALIVTMLIEKVRDNPDSIDLNMVDRISRESGIDITKKAQDAREFFAETQKEDAKA